MLGIPGSPSAAALLGALKINNVIPGPAIGSFPVAGGINDLFLMIGVGFVVYVMNAMHYPIALWSSA